MVLRDGKPAAAIEAKQGDLDVSPCLARRAGPLGAPVPGIQVVGTPGIARRAGEGLWVVSAERFLPTLP